MPIQFLDVNQPLKITLSVPLYVRMSNLTPIAPRSTCFHASPQDLTWTFLNELAAKKSSARGLALHKMFLDVKRPLLITLSVCQSVRIMSDISVGSLNAYRSSEHFSNKEIFFHIAYRINEIRSKELGNGLVVCWGKIWNTIKNTRKMDTHYFLREEEYVAGEEVGCWVPTELNSLIIIFCHLVWGWGVVGTGSPWVNYKIDK